MKAQLQMKVLLIEDDDNHAKIISRFLSNCSGEKVRLSRASRLSEGLKDLTEEDFNAILLDLRLPDSGHEETLQRVHVRAFNTPIVVLSSIEDRDLARKMVHEGAQDYLCKSELSSELLIRAIYNAIERKKSETELHKAIDARDEFLSIASHELKTPLTTLKLQLQVTERVLQTEEDAEKLKVRFEKALTQSQQQVSRLEKLIESLLDISRIQTGKLDLKMDRFNLSTLLEECVDRFEELFANEGSKIETQLERELWIHGDQFRIEQVITNVLTNALKYAPGKLLEITARPESDGLLLSFRDHGSGIPKEKLELIFDRFERAVSSTNISGLGLGLFISRRIVEAHGGTIIAESEPGMGTTFLIRLPTLQNETKPQ